MLVDASRMKATHISVPLLAWLLAACGASTHSPDNPEAAVEARASSAPSGGPSLPDFAAPQAVTVDPATVDRSDVIPYRTLTTADFKASAPPASHSHHAEELGALTYAYITSTEGTRISVEREGNRPFRGRLVSVEFAAEMDRKRSWWNSNIPDDDPYLLQHEQIHFAMTELAARERTLKATQQLAKMTATGSTQDAVQERLLEALNAQLEEAMKELLQESMRFDQETSAHHDARVQQAWFNRVDHRLKQLSDAARPKGN